MKTLLRKFLLVLSLVMAFTIILPKIGFGQTPNRTSAFNFYQEKKYDKALEYINKAIEHEATKQDPKTWYYRAAIFYELAITEVEEYKALDPDPITQSYESCLKCMEFDAVAKKPNKNLQDAQKVMYGLATLIYNDAINVYNNGEYEKALLRFGQYFGTWSKMGNYAMMFKSQLESSGINPNNVYVYAGESAKQLGEDEKAKEYYNSAIKSKYDQVYPYMSLTDIYLSEGDTNSALQTIELGKKNITDDEGKKNITIKELLIYQSMGKLELLTAKLEKAIEEDPENVNLHVTLGETYYQIASYHTVQYELSKEVYLKKGADFEGVKGYYGDPSNNETKTVDGKEVSVYYYGDKYINVIDNKIDSWNTKETGKIDHKTEASKFEAKSMAEYEKSLEITDDAELQFALNSKIGTIYYNRGVDVYNLYADERDYDKIEQLKKEYMRIFDLALPYMEKAMELKPDDKTHIAHLKKIYYLKNDMEKYNKLKE